MRIYQVKPWTIERLMSKTKPAGKCVEWIGARDSNGYGSLTLARPRRRDRAHRLSWELHFGPIASDKLHVCHRCDNPPCVNPEHLFLGTARDNIIDMRDKGRHGGARLDRGIADEIRRACAAGESKTSVGRRFGVSDSHVGGVVSGLFWGDIPRKEIVRPKKKHITVDTVLAIRAALAAGERQVDVAMRYGVTQTNISLIATRKNWKHV